MWSFARCSVRSLTLCVGGLVLLLCASCTAGSGTGRDQESAEPEAGRPTATPTPSEVALAAGEPATVSLPGETGSQAEVEIVVTEVAEGRIQDLDEFRLDRETQRSTPYYADVRVTNAGRTDPARRNVALWGLDSEGTVRPPAELIGPFRPCQDEPLPKRFTGGDSARTCLLYLVPEGLTLDAVQYRFEDQPPFSWRVG